MVRLEPFPPAPAAPAGGAHFATGEPLPRDLLLATVETEEEDDAQARKARRQAARALQGYQGTFCHNPQSSDFHPFLMP
jgi:hypothetical protein